MATKSKKYKYNLSVRFFSIFFVGVFAFLASTNILNYTRKVLFFAGEDTEFKNTPAFHEAFESDFYNISYLKKYMNTFTPDMSYEDFLKTEEAGNIKVRWQEYTDRAIKLFDTIQELKKLKPDDNAHESGDFIVYYNPDTHFYFNPTNNTWATMGELEEYYPGKNIIVYDWESNQNTIEATSVSVSIPADEELFRLEKSYSSIEAWEQKYNQLRSALFTIVNDATSHDTIKTELENELESELRHIYDDEISYIKELLDSLVNIQFVLRDNETGAVISNLTKSQQNNFSDLLYKDSLYSVEFNGNDLKSPVPKRPTESNFFKFLVGTDIISHVSYDEDFYESRFRGYTLLLKLNSDIKQGDSYFNLYNSFNTVKNKNADFYLVFSIIFSVMALASLAVSCNVSKISADGTAFISNTDKTPFVIRFLFTLILLVGIGFVLIVSLGADYFPERLPDSFLWIITDNTIKLIFSLAGSLFAWVIADFVLYIAHNRNAGTLKNRFLIGFTVNKCKALSQSLAPLNVTGKSLKRRLTFALFFHFAFNLFLLALCFTSFFVYAIILIVAFNCVCVVYSLRFIKGVASLANIAEQIKEGTYSTIINPECYVKPLRRFALDLGACRDNVETAVTNAIKGEHLKTELITNVSHDLKTPLTSIINYVSLLKMCDIRGEDANKYLDILDDKSKKLQRLIEDLTEASKASSGNIKMTPRAVCLNELALQAVGENSDVLENVGLDVILNQRQGNIIVDADSQHTFRIIDNLFSNTKKYSLTGTRVYVDIYKENGFGVFAIKNISREKLNITPDELTERFVRGDNSRTTDGSGLGLSIARSFTELQNGIFVIEIDGDMFTASVKLPLSKEKAPADTNKINESAEEAN
ncbi:MAG: HAMP domain-containing histidine kinase [Ruminococcaceae bacterium]|nr:HAMP domain-containing histidine kinase [Oscillospiraceae bacterium]